MARTRKQQAQAAIVAFKKKLLTVDSVAHPHKYVKMCATLRRLEGELERMNKPETEVTPSQAGYQIDGLLKQLATGVTKEEEQTRLIEEIEELANVPEDSPERFQLVHKIVLAMEAGRRAQRMATA